MTKYIFFHIPRTGGASLWHSIANSVNLQEMNVIDTTFESVKRFGCPRHEEELLDQIVKDLVYSENIIIHVHSKFSIKKFDGYKLLMLTRPEKEWKYSLVWVHLKVLFFSNRKLEDQCIHSDDVLRKAHRDLSLNVFRNRLWYLCRVINSRFYKWEEMTKNYHEGDRLVCETSSSKAIPQKLSDFFNRIIETLPHSNEAKFETYAPRTHNSHGPTKYLSICLIYIAPILTKMCRKSTLKVPQIHSLSFIDK